MNCNFLNDMIVFIEDNLTEDIKYDKLAKIVGVSEHSLQRIFAFLTGISISEYVRRRRLSKCYEELKSTDIKVIDLAVKYGYNSPISFARAFKEYFGVTPKECRKSENVYKLYPMIKFDCIQEPFKEVSFEIKDLEEKTIYCFQLDAKRHDDILYKIRNLYEKLEATGEKEKLEAHGIYSISSFDGSSYKYLLGSELKLPRTQIEKIPKGKYAIFKAESRSQLDIVKVYNFIYKSWRDSTRYKISGKFEIEMYTDDACYVMVQIQDKQN